MPKPPIVPLDIFPVGNQCIEIKSRYRHLMGKKSRNGLIIELGQCHFRIDFKFQVD